MPVFPRKTRVDHGFDELAVYALLILVGIIPVAIALAEQAVFGAEATIGLVMLCAGALGVLAYVIRRRQPASGTGSRSR